MSDLIDRESALSAFNTDINKLIVGGEANARAVENYLNGVIDNIRHLPSALGTNLAEVGTDCISRQAAIELLSEYPFEKVVNCISILEEMPSAQSEIIRCKDCKQFRRWIDTDICFCDITEAEMSDNDFCSRAERKEVTE